MNETRAAHPAETSALLRRSKQPAAQLRYRVGQFFASLAPSVSADERAALRRWLPPQGVELFERMLLRDQRHSLNVCQALRAAGHDHPDLLAAALLHDVAKTAQPGRKLGLGHRVLVVLMEAVKPGWVAAVARNDPTDWRYPFHVHLHHPEQGAKLASAAGCSPLTVALIRRHQTKLTGTPVDEEDRLLALLQMADDAN